MSAASPSDVAQAEAIGNYLFCLVVIAPLAVFAGMYALGWAIVNAQAFYRRRSASTLKQDHHAR